MIMNENLTESLKDAILRGNLQEVAALINAGADVHYRNEKGYDALIDAVYGEDDSRLIEMLTLLIQSGASLTGVTTYNESAVRVLSWQGRFDAVKLLLDAEANPDDVKLTPLMKAVAFGTLEDVEDVVRQGADLEAQDYWERTAWLFAIETGDIAKAQFLLERGSNREAWGRCGQPPLFYAVVNEHSAMLKWLLDIGIDVHQADEFGNTALIEAVSYDNLEAVNLLLAAGAEVNHEGNAGPALYHTSNRAIVMRLLEAGADPQELSYEGRRVLLGYPPEPDAELLAVSAEDFRKFRTPRFGVNNPEQMKNPFWEGMIRSGLNAYQAEVQIEGERNYKVRLGPIWCAERFGQSLTFLADGRIVQVAGEHEDGYDPDFCIYNDVFVHDPDGSITIYGYPEDVFPPTDSHTATLSGKYVYLIGSLGYQGTRRFGETPVYRLDTDTFQIERFSTSGDNPGWIYKHRATLSGDAEIRVAGGKIATETGGREDHTNNADAYVLNTKTGVWAVTTS